ncbi:hypothetical protein [Pseudonocardia sp. WMMC193]|nr:hypothetical protein [Pseudonocardia sp. WMMC193]MCF7553828.1 hypothetical protein [Pseudonocardia sp. WMMC193]
MLLLISVYQCSTRPDDRMVTDLHEADALTKRITGIAATLGVPECGFP